MEEEAWFYRGEELRLLGEASREGQSFSKKLNKKGQASSRSLTKGSSFSLKLSKRVKTNLKGAKTRTKPSDSGSGVKQLEHT